METVKTQSWTMILQKDKADKLFNVRRSRPFKTKCDNPWLCNVAWPVTLALNIMSAKDKKTKVKKVKEQKIKGDRNGKK